ncbi:MAG: hypothetical protein JRI97_04345 [Deltaproteobacteria bacterium]|nr:hypothetical protein [Deltaproteobacteria bacterium]
MLHWAGTGGPFAFWCGGEGCVFFRPLAAASIFVDYRLWGLFPAGFHAVNVLLHGVNAFLVYVLFSRVFPRSRKAGLLAGLLFLLLPAHVEAVTWISCRTDLLAAFFALLSLIAFARSLKPPPENAPRPRRAAIFAAAPLFFLASLLSKESTAALPLVAALMAAAHPSFRLERDGRRAAAAVGLLALVMGGYLLWRRAALGVWVGGYGVEAHFLKAWSSPLLTTKLLAAFLAKTFLPPQAAGPLWALRGRPFLAAAVLVCALAVLLVLRTPARDLKTMGLLLACQAAALLPVLGLGVSLDTTVGDRFLYFPSVFGVFALSALLVSLAPNRNPVAVAIPVLALFSAFVLANQVPWVKAGQAARQVLDQVGRDRGRAEIVVHAPKAMQGAYVFKNGLKQAVLVYYGQEVWDKVRAGGASPPALAVRGPAPGSGED